MTYECVCETYEGDACEFSTTRMVAARKEYHCCECHDTIKVGERHEKMVYKLEGELCQERTCAFCSEERNRLSKAYPDMPPVIGELACWLVAELRGEIYG